MAYIDQAKKKQIAAKLKAVVPAGWKYSLAIRNHSTLCMTITQAPVNLLAAYQRGFAFMADGCPNFYHDTSNKAGKKDCTHIQVNEHHMDRAFDAFGPDACLNTMWKIKEALNLYGEEGSNHDNSDSMSDYFDVGWYVNIHVGKWDAPFCHVVPATNAQKLAAVKAKIEEGKPAKSMKPSLPDIIVQAVGTPWKPKPTVIKYIKAPTPQEVVAQALADCLKV